jgi:hypothetical protein
MSTPASPPHPESTTESWEACPNTYLSRLQVGDHAYVAYDPNLANRVRVQPNLNGRIRGFIQPGDSMEILDGPECAEGWVWWYVRAANSNLTGWTCEGDRDHYWLVPTTR